MALASRFWAFMLSAVYALCDVSIVMLNVIMLIVVAPKQTLQKLLRL
jgi:hypothetical protein